MMNGMNRFAKCVSPRPPASGLFWGLKSPASSLQPPAFPAAFRLRRGFTLIEIMVVVIVLGILAAIIVPNITGRTDEAKVSKARSDISEIMMLLENFKLDMGRYPDEAEGLDVLRNPPNSEDSKSWKGPYAKRPIPSDPWGNPYHYYCPAPNDLDAVGVESFGKDGQPEGDKDAKDIRSWENYEEEK